MYFVAPAFLSPILGLAGTIAKALSLTNEDCHRVMFIERAIIDGPCLNIFIAKSAVGGLLVHVLILLNLVLLMPQVSRMVNDGCVVDCQDPSD
jgi:hypothetical protein